MKSLFSSTALCVALLAAFAPSATAQNVPRVINGGIVNGKAISLPKPAYPASAREAGISAVVAVNIIIGENGDVVSASAELNDQRERRDVDGSKLDPLPADPTLRDAAEAAARLAEFAPTRLNGEPVQINGRLVYSFVANSGEASIEPPPVPKTVTGGVLNGRASSLPAPAYPPAAVAVRAQGAVSVQVKIDESGSVIEAAAVSGHPLLRAAAEAAAREAKFAPTLLSGTPIKVSGILTYNFVLPKVD